MKPAPFLAAVLAAHAVSAAALAQFDAEGRINPDALYAEAYEAYEADDFALARTRALQAARAGHVRAGTLAAHLMERGLGGPALEDGARELYEASADAGDADAHYALGLMARDGRAGLDREDAAVHFQRSVELGREGARVELAMLYIEGGGVQPDQERARVLLGQAALAGSTLAQRALGLLLLTESDLATELHEAETWLTNAAAAGDAEAAYALGVSYATGDKLPRDDAKAATYLRQAADAGVAAALADYGLLLYQGRGVERSYEGAAGFFHRAAEAGDQEGQTLYAFALAKGEGVERNLEEAYYWALLSAEQGAASALSYELDRFRLITALEQTLPDEAQDRVHDRIEAALTP